MKEPFPSDIGYKLTSESRDFDPLKMAESITDSRIYGFTEIKTE